MICRRDVLRWVVLLLVVVCGAQGSLREEEASVTSHQSKYSEQR
jgi:hypothetical protein